jgi:hypothetical protein
MATSKAAAAMVNQRSVASIARARGGSERTRNRLSLQLAQQFGSKNGLRNSASPTAASTASR